MKKILLVPVLILAMCIELDAQVKYGDNPNTINPNAILELESTSKGLLLPRLTMAQRDAMSGVPDGLLIYNTDDSCMNLFNRGEWNSLCDTELDYCSVVKVTDTTSAGSTPTSDPNSLSAGQAFVPNDPENDCALYITDNGQLWIWDGSNYITNAIKVNPWWNNATNLESNSLNDQIYHLGSVNIGTGNSSDDGSLNLTVGLKDSVIGGGQHNIVSGWGNTVSGSRNLVTGTVNKNIYGFNSAVHGVFNSDIGQYNLVSGNGNNNVHGQGNIVGGIGNANINHYNAVIGYFNTNVYGQGTAVFGQNNNSINSSSVVGGWGNQRIGYYNAVFGYDNDSVTNYNIVSGRENSSILGLYNAVFGYQNTTGTGDYILMSGRNLQANNTMHAATVLGRYNLPVANSLLIIGNGTSTTSRSNAFTVKNASLIMPKAASAPASPVEGEMYFNSTDKRTYIYDGTTWRALY